MEESCSSVFCLSKLDLLMLCSLDCRKTCKENWIEAVAYEHKL
jgi:hypothetical protein